MVDKGKSLHIKSLLWSEYTNEELANKLAEIIEVRDIHLIPCILESRPLYQRNVWVTGSIY